MSAAELVPPVLVDDPKHAKLRRLKARVRELEATLAEVQQLNDDLKWQRDAARARVTRQQSDIRDLQAQLPRPARPQLPIRNTGTGDLL